MSTPPEEDEQYTEDMKGRVGGWSLDPGDRTAFGLTVLAILLFLGVATILVFVIVEGVKSL